MNGRGQSFIVSMHGHDRPGITEGAEAAVAGALRRISGMATVIDDVSGRTFMRPENQGCPRG